MATPDQLAAMAAVKAQGAAFARGLPPCPTNLNNTMAQPGVYAFLPPGTVGVYVWGPEVGLSVPMAEFLTATGQPKTTVTFTLPVAAIGRLTLQGLEELWTRGGSKVRSGQAPLPIGRGSMKVCLDWCSATVSYGIDARCNNIVSLSQSADGEAKVFKTYDVYASKSGSSINLKIVGVPYSGWESFWRSVTRKLDAISGWLCRNASAFTMTLPPGYQQGMSAYMQLVTKDCGGTQLPVEQLPPPPPPSPPAPPWWEDRRVLIGAGAAAVLVFGAVLIKAARSE